MISTGRTEDTHTWGHRPQSSRSASSQRLWFLSKSLQLHTRKRGAGGLVCCLNKYHCFFQRCELPYLGNERRGYSSSQRLWEGLVWTLKNLYKRHQTKGEETEDICSCWRWTNAKHGTKKKRTKHREHTVIYFFFHLSEYIVVIRFSFLSDCRIIIGTQLANVMLFCNQLWLFKIKSFM